jgi:hypothetical protein
LDAAGSQVKEQTKPDLLTIDLDTTLKGFNTIEELTAFYIQANSSHKLSENQIKLFSNRKQQLTK